MVLGVRFAALIVASGGAPSYEMLNGLVQLNDYSASYNGLVVLDRDVNNDRNGLVAITLEENNQ